MADCTVCNGSGALVCSECQGLGKVGASGTDIFSECKGSGVVDCSNCQPEPQAQVRATSVRAQGQAETNFDSTTEEKANFLANVELFKHLNPETLRKLASRVHLVSLPAGHVIRENEPTDGLYIIKSGMAQVTKSAGGGDLEVDLATLVQGESFGEIGLIDGLPRSANVTAIEPLTCYYLPRPVFLTAVAENLEIALGMLPAMAAMVRNADEIAQTILSMFVKEK